LSVSLGSLFPRSISAQESGVPQTLARLSSGKSTRIVCLGDSVTGIYYHTGGRRAYPEVLQLTLQKQFPGVEIQVINAGISGNTTADALRRLEADVLNHRPHLVTIMFGLNDMVSLSAIQFETNLNSLVDQIQAQGAEIILGTPNDVIENVGRPRKTLMESCLIITKVGKERGVPVCQINSAYAQYRDIDPKSWRFLFSDEIHPNMDGHRLNARLFNRLISGQDLSLNDIGPPQPATPHSLRRKKSDQPIRILAATPADRHLATALPQLDPSIKFQIQPWDVSGKTLAEIEESARQIRKRQDHDLVVVSVPMEVTPAATASENEISSFSWILNHSLSFGRQEWDVVVIAPSVWGGPLTELSGAREEFTRRMTRAQDLSLIARSDEQATGSPIALIVDWLRKEGW
jgi:lysophospholipase L1-like esterase